MWQNFCVLTLTALTVASATRSGMGIEDEAGVSRGIELMGIVEIAGSMKDKSGLDEVFSVERKSDSTQDDHDGLPPFSNDMLGGFSALAYTGSNQTYYALSDRGPLDGAVDWNCRIHKIRIPIGEDTNQSLQVELLETVLLTDEEGIPFTGMASACPSTRMSNVATGSLFSTPASRLDPEGIRISKNGNIFISDEYGPRVIEFSPAGKMIHELKVPQRYKGDDPSSTTVDRNSNQRSGRSTNRGMEGLAISLDDATLFGLMQSPLLQDCQWVQQAKYPTGLNCRLWASPIRGEGSKELLYHLDDSANGLNEILAVTDDDFLVIERDGEAGESARFKRIFLISTERASDISGIDRLPPMKLPDRVQPVSKTLLIDLLHPQWNLAGKTMPEKIEGLAFGPDLIDGRRTLLVTSDNDFEPSAASFIYVFAIPRTTLE